MTRLISTLIGCVLVLPAFATPFAPPCTGCPETEFPAYPQTGHWIDYSRSGTGFNLDIQNGILLGVYYGYREDGSSAWYVFSGELEPVEDDPTTYWKLETGLLEMAEGQVLGQPYQAPDIVAESQIELRFTGRSLMHFRVDGGVEYAVSPFIFGSATSQPFPEHSNLPLPSLDDGQWSTWAVPWMLFEYSPYVPGLDDLYLRKHHSLIVWAGSNPNSEKTSPYEITLYYRFTGPSPAPWLPVGELICDSFDALSDRFPDLSPAAQGETPVCVVWWQFERWTEDFDGPREFFFMPIADLTDRRFRAVSETGWVLEGFRLSYD